MKVEVLGDCKNSIVFEVSAERFEEGLKYSYNKNKFNINVPGFRPGKVPRKLIEKQFGEKVLFDDAIEYVLRDAYGKAMEESGLDMITQPELTNFEMQPDRSVVFTAIAYTKPEVQLGNFRGLTYKKTDTNPTEAEIMAQINEALEKNTREISVTDRPVINGDLVIIDFTGYIDGKAFEGGSGSDYQLVIGTHSFIDTFEEQLIGHEIGDDVIVKVRFPDEYHVEDLAGKDAEFNVSINEIKTRERPILDDEFASDVSEYDTLDEYKQSIAEKIRTSKINNAKYDMESQLIHQLISNSEVKIPEIMVENQMNARMDEFSRGIEAKGISLENYLSYFGKTKEELLESYRDVSIEAIKTNLLLNELIRAEAIEADAEEIEQQVKQILKANEENANEKIDVEELRSNLNLEMAFRKALDLIIEHSNIIEDDDTQSQEDLA